MIKHLSKREKTIFGLCVTIVCAYAGYAGFIKPREANITSVNNKLRTYQERINKSLSIIQKSRHMDQQYALYLNQFRQTKTDEAIMASTLSEIEKVAGEFNLIIADLKPNKVKHEDYFNQFSVTLQINSEFIEILPFLHTLQSRPYYFNLTEAVFSRVSHKSLKGIKTQLILNKLLFMKPLGESASLEGSIKNEFQTDKKTNITTPQTIPLPIPKPFSFYKKTFAQRDLFRKAAQATTDAIDTTANPLKLESDLNKRWAIVGIVLDQDSKAIIEDKKTKQTFFASEGGKVGNAIIRTIQENKVFLEYNGRRVELVQ